MGKRRINLKVWKVGMEMFPPAEVLDNSTISEYGACPRKGFYRDGLRRGFKGINYSIQFGLAYHKYREVVEELMRARSSRMTEEIHMEAVDAALVGFEDPPMEDKNGFLDRGRLFRSCDEARKRIEREQLNNAIEVTRNEDAFDLELPFAVCKECGYAILLENNVTPICRQCGMDSFFHARHGGRIDQFIKDHSMKSVDRIRDFKTTKYKPDNYEEKFDPNNQFFGYTWAGEELSGRKFDGALIETLYNTKTRGPLITQHYVSYSEGQIEDWIVGMMMERSMIQMMWNRVEELGYLAFPKRTSECSGWGGCPFRGACRTGSAFELEAWLESNTIESTWDFTDPSLEESKA